MYTYTNRVTLVFQLAKWIYLFYGVVPTRWVMIVDIRNLSIRSLNVQIKY